MGFSVASDSAYGRGSDSTSSGSVSKPSSTPASGYSSGSVKSSTVSPSSSGSSSKPSSDSSTPSSGYSSGSVKSSTSVPSTSKPSSGSSSSDVNQSTSSAAPKASTNYNSTNTSHTFVFFPTPIRYSDSYGVTQTRYQMPSIWGVLLDIVILAIFVALGIWVYRKYNHKD